MASWILCTGWTWVIILGKRVLDIKCCRLLPIFDLKISVRVKQVDMGSCWNSLEGWDQGRKAIMIKLLSSVEDSNSSVGWHALAVSHSKINYSVKTVKFSLSYINHSMFFTDISAWIQMLKLSFNLIKMYWVNSSLKST